MGRFLRLCPWGRWLLFKLQRETDTRGEPPFWSLTRTSAVDGAVSWGARSAAPFSSLEGQTELRELKLIQKAGDDWQENQSEMSGSALPWH